MNRIAAYIIAFVLLGMIFNSCRREEEFTTSSSAKLTFSDDTLFFDTIFSQSGTGNPICVTKQLRVVNHNDKAVRVNISIKGSAMGSVKMNVDGVPTNSVKSKEISANDSIILFVQLYSNPGNNFIVTDQVLFETNGNLQDVDVVGYGRDAYYHDGQTWDSTVTTITWAADKPHVIYNSILVDEKQTLIIPAGVKVYSHINSTLYIAGTLQVNGTINDPVVFNGDRLDEEGANFSGQWIGIRILPRSKDNIINAAIFRNGVLAIEVDSVPPNANPNLTISNCYIDNFKAAGIVGYSATINATNNVVSNCGQFSFYGVLGGNYTLHHNTFANYLTSGGRQNPQFLLDNSPYDDGKGNVLKIELKYELINNLIYGSLEEELLFNLNPDGHPGTSQRIIQTNLFRTKLNLGANNNILNQDPLFENVGENKYYLKANSPAKGKGTPGVITDISGAIRSTTAPTIGAFE